MPMKVDQTKGPYAAIAAVQPITPAPCLGEWAKMMGYCRKVAAFPMPEAKKMTNIRVTNSGNWLTEVGVSTPENIIARPLANIITPEIEVRTAPQILSVMGPVRTLIVDPIKGPRKANFNGSGASTKPP